MTEKLTLGWEEWASLPRLGLPAIKAKIDTGARTSSLHAFAVEPFGSPDRPRVRFGLHPIPNRPEVEIYCSARVIDRREITSSNGEAEMRYIIETPVNIGGREWPIEISLTNRESMQYRMLIGRHALMKDDAVEPRRSFIQGELSYDVYKPQASKPEVQRSLRIAILTREPENYSTQRLIEAATARDHVVELIDTRRCYMNINAFSPEVYYDGRPLPRFDAVIPRIGASLTSYGMAVVRQFEALGTYCVNTSTSIGNSRDKLLAHQLLAKHGIGMPTTAFASSPKDSDNLIELVGQTPIIIKLLESTQGRGVVLAETKKAAQSVIGAFRNLNANFLVQEFVKEAEGVDIRCLVVDGKVVASMRREAQTGDFRSNLHRGGTARSVRITKEERDAAIRAAKILGLEVAGVDLLRSNSGPKVLEVNSSPGLQGIESVSNKDIADLIIQHIERRAHPIVRRRTGRRAAAD